ncbi:unnamed protein product [Rhizophagus irregularis]|uniref:Uncharacterized protein n=1 Tax=Rhizophagus irregularis TaxID=588596 RepID=A0A916EGP8_9GLOM|nr:unnamed protein product [Rhizophagus irregularis]
MSIYLLPTIDNLRKRNELYNQVKCPMCLHDDEDIRHIVICPGHEDGFQKYIWNPRCYELNILEAKLGITKKDKMNTRSHSCSISQQLDIQQTQGTLDKNELLRETLTRCKNYIHSLITKGSSQLWKT